MRECETRHGIIGDGLAPHAVDRPALLMRLVRETGIASPSATLVEMMQLALDRVCAYGGWSVGHAFHVETCARRTLRSARIWCLADRRRFTAFFELSDQRTPDASHALPGRALATRAAAWIADLHDSVTSPRDAALAALGLRAGFAFPVLIGDQVVALLEFYAESPRVPDAPLLDAVGRIAVTLAQVAERERSERALRRAGERDAATFEGSVDPVVTLDASGGVVMLSRAAERMFGSRASELRGEPMGERLIAPAARARFTDTLRELATRETAVATHSLDVVGQRCDGVEFPATLTVTRIRRRGDAWIVIHLRDTSDARRAEHRLAVQYGVTRALAESASLAEAGAAIARALTEGLDAAACMVWSAESPDDAFACIAAWASPRSELQAWLAERVRHRADDIVHGVEASGAPSWIPQLTDARFPWGERASHVGLRSVFAFPVHVTQDVVAVIEIFHAHSLKPDADLVELCDALGSQIGQFIARARSQRALAQRGARLAAFFAHTSDVIVDLDDEGTVRAISPSIEPILGYRPEEFIGIPLWAYVHSDDVQVSTDAFRAAVAGDDARARAEMRVRHKDGSWRFIEGLGRRLPGGASGERGVLVNARDVSARKQGEEALRAAEARVRKRARRLSKLSQQLIERQENDRLHLARELHDEIGQSLSALKLNLLAPSGGDGTPSLHIAESIAIIDHTLAQVRNLSLDLRPPLLDDVGLVAALRWHVDRQAQLAGWKVRFRARFAEDGLTQAVATACFRVTQEALTNVIRHARATHVDVLLRRDPLCLSLIIRDDGAGFDLDDVQSRGMSGASLGLLGMRERVALLGGALAITSAVGRGTEVRADLPLARKSAAGAAT
jgi:PAS domain S-box-containing protein